MNMLNHFLVNIGRSDKLLTEEEFDSLSKETTTGTNDNRCIPAKDMMRLV
jgi:hypothetical protein